MRPVRLDDMDWLAIGSCQRVEGGGEIRERSTSTVERVEAEAEDIPSGGRAESVDGQGREPVLLEGQAQASTDVDHDRWLGDASVHGVDDIGARDGIEGGELGEVCNTGGAQGDGWVG